MRESKFLANLDKKEVVFPRGIGLGGETLEHTGFVGSLSDALYLLVTVRSDRDVPPTMAAGRWVGDRVLVIDNDPSGSPDRYTQDLSQYQLSEEDMQSIVELLEVEKIVSNVETVRLYTPPSPSSEKVNTEILDKLHGRQWTDLTPLVREAFSTLYYIDYKEWDSKDPETSSKGFLQKERSFVKWSSESQPDFDYWWDLNEFHKNILPVRTESGAISRKRLHSTRTYKPTPGDEVKTVSLDYSSARTLRVDHYFTKTDRQGKRDGKLYRLSPPLEAYVWADEEWTKSDTLLGNLRRKKTNYSRIPVYEAEQLFPRAFKGVEAKQIVRIVKIFRKLWVQAQSEKNVPANEKLYSHVLRKAEFADRETTLLWHSMHNFTPALDRAVISVWKNVIEWVDAGKDALEEFDLPSGISVEGKTRASAREIVKRHLLRDWISKDLFDFETVTNDEKDLWLKYLPYPDAKIFPDKSTPGRKVSQKQREDFFRSIYSDLPARAAFLKDFRLACNQPSNERILRDNPQIVDAQSQEKFLDSWRRSKGDWTDSELYEVLRKGV